MTRRALIIVDVQNDFCEGGALPVTGGLAVAANIATYVETHEGEYDLIIASRDWHDADDTNSGHFAPTGQQPDFVNTWPVHCEAETTGAAFAEPIAATIAAHHDAIISKGMGEPAYSAFQGVSQSGRTLNDLLADNGIQRVDVCGIATDYCVKATALDAKASGYDVALLPGLHAGVAPETTREALRLLGSRGVVLDGEDAR